MEIVEFLRACLDEDERIAQATLWDDDSGLGSGRWIAYDRGPRDGFREARWVVIDGADEGVMDSRPQAADDEAVARHIAEWDPARVLREIHAKRQMLALHVITAEKAAVPPFDSYTGERNPDEYNVTCAVCGWASDDRSSACLTLRLLALPYADRPSYRAEWAPTP